jgi:hypothetical protein
MRLLILLTACFILFNSCASGNQPKRTPVPLPPGVEKGMKWEEAATFGYNEDIYTTPDYVAEVKRGTRHLLFELRKASKNNICKDEPPHLLIQYVVNKEGEIMGIHPKQKINPQCKALLAQTFKRFEFYPAEYQQKKVNVLMALTISVRPF